ncbi:MAG: glycerol-3-phosphate 1-O-acyltransferase PlsY [Ruminococcus sp.]|nr:glycerol-3-phosphate 1-O-acyltransferase PlsY [Ruminococcus sp.]
MKYALCLIITALLSYLWGSLNSAIITVKLLKGEDIREKGSGNAGLTNVLRVYGKGAALTTLIFDLIKGVAAVVAARLIVTNLAGVTFFGGDKIFIGYIAGLFTIIGHMFPVFYGFHGGKGVLLAATTLIAMDPLTCIVSLTVFAVLVAVTKYVSVGSICAAITYPVFTLIYQSIRADAYPGHIQNFLVAAVIGGMIVYMHKPNIERLRAGTENKFGQKKKNPVENDAPADRAR